MIKLDGLVFFRTTQLLQVFVAHVSTSFEACVKLKATQCTNCYGNRIKWFFSLYFTYTVFTVNTKCIENALSFS